MELIDKSNYLTVTTFDLVKDCLQTFFKFTAVLCPSNHCAHIERNQGFPNERSGDIPFDNTARQTFHDGRFSHPWFADQNRVVLGATRKNLDSSTHFLITTDYRVDLAFAGQRGEVKAVLVKCLESALWVLCVHACAPFCF